MTNIIYL